MGFSAVDCKRALRECEDDLNLAALWLSVHATPCKNPPTTTTAATSNTSKDKGGIAPLSDNQLAEKAEGSFSITAMEVRKELLQKMNITTKHIRLKIDKEQI
jgi:hypothetical protein